MNGRKTLGIVLIVVSLVLAIAALILGFTDETFVPSFGMEPNVVAGFYGGGAAVMLVLGIFLMVLQPAPTRYTAPAAPPTEDPPVVIKRTEMSWASQPTAEAPPDLQSRLDDVNQRMSRAKVQYGLEQISKESYQIMMKDLEKEKSEIEIKIARGER